MKTEEIIEGNKLIAEFMGYKFTAGDCVIDDVRATTMPISDWGKYHSSWNWLMTVVEKIESISDNPCIQFEIMICMNVCQIQSEEEIDIANVDSTTKIKAVWLAVIEFIKWYNKNKTITNPLSL